MKKGNLLSRTEMKKISGGVAAYNCESWRNQEFLTCFNCCITVYSADDCLTPKNCGETPIVVNPKND